MAQAAGRRHRRGQLKPSRQPVPLGAVELMVVGVVVEDVDDDDDELLVVELGQVEDVLEVLEDVELLVVAGDVVVAVPIVDGAAEEPVVGVGDGDADNAGPGAEPAISDGDGSCPRPARDDREATEGAAYESTTIWAGAATTLGSAPDGDPVRGAPAPPTTGPWAERRGSWVVGATCVHHATDATPSDAAATGTSTARANGTAAVPTQTARPTRLARRPNITVMPRGGRARIIACTAPRATSATCPCAMLTRSPATCVPSDAHASWNNRGDRMASIPYNQTSPGMVRAIHENTVARAQGVRASPVDRPRRPGHKLRSTGRMEPNRSGTPARSARM